MDFHPVNLLNSTVEVFGEVRLYDPSSSDELESAHSLIRRLRMLQETLEQASGLPVRSSTRKNGSLHYLMKKRLQKEIDELSNKYKAVIQVHTIRHIADAREIIGENLYFRQIQSIRQKLK